MTDGRILQLWSLALLAVAPTLAQPSDSGNRLRLESLLVPWGGPVGFSRLYRESVETFFTAEADYRGGDYESAARTLDKFWMEHPAGSDEWRGAAGEAQTLAVTKGVSFGTPPCYSALRMLTEATAWHVRENAAASPKAQPIQLTVVLVGHSTGIEPASLAELVTGTGRVIHHSLNESVARPGSELINESLFLFGEYIRAITGGRLWIEVKLLPLPDLDVPVEVAEKTLQVAGRDRASRFAGLPAGAESRVWQAVPEAVRRETDWWWIIYPSHFPENAVEFAQQEMITGGMSFGPDGHSPAFVIDDLWLVRVPHHLGRGEYTQAERRAFLPQWFQHEFFHHLYRTYPELKLESASHQWFDRSRWPADFNGSLESDYYAESVAKRLRSASPPLHIALRYAPPHEKLLSKITPQMLLGTYRHEPAANDWQTGTIQVDAQKLLRWTNTAGVSWSLSLDTKNGVLQTGSGNPYYSDYPSIGRVFRIELRRGEDGEYVAEVAGFWFLGGLYAKLR